MKNIKRVAAITMAASGLALAGAGVASAQSGPQAVGGAVHSPGIISGNTVQVPVHVPVNACGVTATVIGALNPTFGNPCVNY
ncbi:chaplin [Streptomyces kronopolitis]|uniref:Small membrane protein n=2 Tax=Streptomyces kronopolitis TaxID=1612435 RepID=A0ABQ2JYM1_9ACTN|nr:MULTISPECIES: chaplin [Streptomyces]MCL6302454.1 chaplin [Streptomyces kronopolitis]GGN59411.1 small membrane protein [Streptomyces kronopolitis]GLW13268.1 small membrane protein [Streptomyces sp. NBRC 13847]